MSTAAPAPSAADTPVHPLLKVLSFIGPNITPLTPSSEYVGRKYDFLTFSFRPALFVTEGFILFTLLALVGAYFLGKSYNEGIGKKWVGQHESFLTEQFRSFTPSSKSSPLSNGPDTLIYYGTGRRNLLGAHVTHHLLPRHNPIALLFNIVRGLLDPPYGNEIGVFEDEVLLDITLGEGTSGIQSETIGVWGIAKKGGTLTDLRRERWDASFPKAVDWEGVLPKSHMALQEAQDCTEAMFALGGDKKAGSGPSLTGLVEMLRDEKEGGGIGMLKWLMITDQPPYQPIKGPLPNSLRSRHLLARFRLDTSKNGSEITAAWLKVLIGNLPDVLASIAAQSAPGTASSPAQGNAGKVVLKPETVRKLRKIRTDLDASLTASHQSTLKETRAEEEAEVLRKARKEKEDEKRKVREAMSEKERQKLDEKERRKKEKKAMMAKMKK